MRVFAAHLKKDLRDQRGTLLGLAFLIAIGTLATTYALPESSVRFGQLLAPALVLGALIGAIAVAADLIPCETQRGTVALLARLPGGLRAAFFSKSSTVLLSCVCTAAFAYAAMWVAGSLRCGVAWTHPMAEHFAIRESFCVIALGYGLWVLAIASWMPRGLPALFVPPLFAAPHWLALGILGPLGSGVVARDWLVDGDLTWLLLAQPPLALAVCYVSLVHGRRWSGGPGASARIGGLATLVAMLPAWGVLTVRSWVWLTPSQAQLAAGELIGLPGEGGAFTFASLQRDAGWPSQVWAIELETGSTTRVEGFGATVKPWTQTYSGFPLEAHGFRYLEVTARDGDKSIVDTRDLAVVARPKDVTLDAHLRELFRTALADTSSMRTPDGRRAWFLEGRFETEGANGRVESVALPRGTSLAWRAGNGVLDCVGERGITLFDLTRQRLVVERSIKSPRMACLDRFWLVPSTSAVCSPWQLLDPDTGETVALPDELARAEVVAVFCDGRVLLATGKGETGAARGRLLLARLPGGPFEEVALPERFTAPNGWAVSAHSLDYEPGNAEPELLLSLGALGVGSFASTYRLGDQTLGPAWPAYRIACRLGRDTIKVLGEDGHTVERVHLRTGARTPLRTLESRFGDLQR